MKEYPRSLTTISLPDGAQPAARDATFDILKGIGILEVILHHVTSHSARKYATMGETEWWALVVTNRAFHFAVPVFLLASALLLARSVASKAKPDWKRFFLRRGERTVWPYVVWTALYWLFRVRFVKVGSDVSPIPLRMAWGNVMTLPSLFAHPNLLLQDLFWGRGYYHLYFMAVLIQFALLFPFIYYGLRRVRISFGVTVAAASALQLGVHYAQSHYWQLRSPASTVLWYLPPVLLGTWLGLNWAQWPTVWRKWRVAFIGATVFGGTVYMTLSLRLLMGLPTYGPAFNIAVQVFTLGMALLLLRWSGTLSHGSAFGRWLAQVGDKSLPLYLMHPGVMYLISGPRISGVIGRFHVEALVVLVLTLIVTWCLTWLLSVLHLDVLAFGRRFALRSFRFTLRRPSV